MPLSVPTGFQESVNLSDLSDSILVLIEVSWVDEAEAIQTLRLTSNTEPTVRGGQTFNPGPVGLKRFGRSANRTTRARLTLAIGGEIVQGIREAQGDFTVSSWIVQASDPDTAIHSMENATLREAEYGLVMMDAEIAFPTTASAAVPRHLISPLTFPGLFPDADVLG